LVSCSTFKGHARSIIMSNGYTQAYF